MSNPMHEQIRDAYKAMAHVYRPMAPSDGFGNITVAEKDLDLELEATRFAAYWLKQEDKREFLIGVPDYPYAPAMVYLVMAAQCCCSGRSKRNDEDILRLTDLARMAIEKQ